MSRFCRALAVSVGIALCATPAIAQDVPPPSAATEEAIIAWAKAAKIADDTASPKAAWNMVGATDDGLLMAAVEPKDAAGIAKVGIRLERFKPAGGRSEASMFDLDCGKQLIKATLDASYGDHNLTGAKQDRPLNGAWAPVASNDLVNQLKNDACSASVAAAPAARPATAAAAGNIPDYKSERAMRDWMRQNGVAQDGTSGEREWLLVGYTPEGVMLSRRELDMRRTNGRQTVVIMRLERFNPVSVETVSASLSETQDYALNCQNEQIRLISRTLFTGHNIQGKGVVQKVEQPWAPVKSNALMNSTAADICKAIEVRPSFETRVR